MHQKQGRSETFSLLKEHLHVYMQDNHSHLITNVHVWIFFRLLDPWQALVMSFTAKQELSVIKQGAYHHFAIHEF